MTGTRLKDSEACTGIYDRKTELTDGQRFLQKGKGKNGSERK